MPVAHLEDRAVIAVTGPEARGFLQGLITNDVERLAPGQGVYAALLTPQGKILFDFFLVEGDAAILIDCLAAMRDALLKRLSMYKLRAKVTLEPRDQLAVLAEWGGGHAKYTIAYPDPRIPALGTRAVVAKGEMHTGLEPAAIYHAHRLALGVPEATDFGSDKMFALDADLDELHAVDFKKGCYIGQELTARMKHRGTARKRLLAVAGTALPGPDTFVRAGDKDIGEITATYGDKGFALIRLDRLEEAQGAPVNAGSSRVELWKPGWLFP
ncbi:MAG: folate-binding protein YgfZ [Alphaproteobacteria bacterium]|nr:folate-binding protein YgfZ [Alphaproteobacteria bacterium]MBL6936354.1 folate-binding protein YgfZ [Alphaproteobacteria bacterium]MBL7098595.1 folate-binding protein YgfZ [Alphaproteobacteria bacterium]